MAAKDYFILCGYGKAYIAKLSGKPNLMTADRHEIPEQDIINLIDWYLAAKGEHGIVFESNLRKGMDVEIKYKKSEQ